MPAFTEQEIEEIAGSYDFFGVNAYTTRVVTTQIKSPTPPNWEGDRDTTEVSNNQIFTDIF